MSDGKPVVTLLRTIPPLTEVPGQLRHLADQIEKGEIQAECCLAIVVPDPATPPTVFTWGRGDHYRWMGALACALAQVSAVEESA